MSSSITEGETDLAEYAAIRNRARCPTHSGELLREDVIAATSKSKTGIARLLGISRRHLHEIARRAEARKPRGRRPSRQAVRRRRRGMEPDANRLRRLARRVRHRRQRGPDAERSLRCGGAGATAN